MEIFRSCLNGLPSVKVGGDVVSIRYSGFTISADILTRGEILKVYQITQGKFSKTPLQCFGDLFNVLSDYLESRREGTSPVYQRRPLSIYSNEPETCLLEEMFDEEVKNWIQSNAGEIEDVFNQITSILEGK